MNCFIYFHLWFVSFRVFPLNSQGIMMFIKLVSIHVKEVLRSGVTVLLLLLVSSSKFNICRCGKFGSVYLDANFFLIKTSFLIFKFLGG